MLDSRHSRGISAIQFNDARWKQLLRQRQVIIGVSALQERENRTRNATTDGVSDVWARMRTHEPSSSSRPAVSHVTTSAVQQASFSNPTDKRLQDRNVPDWASKEDKRYHCVPSLWHLFVC